MARTTTRICAACGRTMKGRKLDAAVFSRHTGNYYCGPTEPCHTRKPRKRPAPSVEVSIL